MLGFFLPNEGFAAPVDGCDLKPNAYLKIDETGKITVFVARQEMGQGVNTSLPMIVAEDLEANWSNVHVEIAAYGTMKMGEHDTGGSQSVLTDFNNLRKAGAIAKSMLLSAAAKRWNIKEEKCVAEFGTVVNPVNKARLNYGELVCEAAKLPIPKEVVLKQSKDFKVIGKAVPKTNLKDIITGKAKYGIDVKVPDMLYATVERCPVLNGKLISFDDAACKDLAGFIKTVSFEATEAPMHLHAGVAVIATSTWAAMKARTLLKVIWDEGDNNNESTEELFKTFRERSKEKPAIEVYKKGDTTAVNESKENNIESVFSAPFLAHGTMEPMNFIVSVKTDSCELWGGLQLPDWAVGTIAQELGLKAEQIKTNLTLIGGGFGRRLHFDFALEAVKIAKQIDKPVQVIWNRTDDIRNDTYRPANLHRMKAAWDANGKLQSWQHHQVATAIGIMTDGPDAKNYAEVQGGGSSDFWYDVPNVLTGYTHVDFNLNRGWVRAVEICVNTFAVESFIDEVAHRLKKDPLNYRLSLLSTMPKRNGKDLQQDPMRIAGVLKLAADKIGYKNPRKKNHFIGLATHHFTFAKSYAAHAIEIELLEPRKFKIVKVVAAVDCGIVINPDGLKSQVEGGCAFALSQALMSEINVLNSRVVEDGFFTYQLLRFNEMPAIEVYAVKSDEEPGGIGEIGLPTVAPALCNALAAAGFRPYALPIKKEGFEWV